MKLSVYESYDDLPLFLNAKMVAQVLGVSISTAYELLNDPGFPTLRVGKRMVVPKEKFILWAEGQSGRCEMRKQYWPKRDPIKNYFPLPNEIFSLGLSAGAIAVYGFSPPPGGPEDLSVRGQLPNHRRSGGDERQHGAQVCDRAGGTGSDPDGAHHRHHPGRPHPQRLSCVTTSCPSRCPSSSSMRGSSTQLTWRWNDRERNSTWRR